MVGGGKKRDCLHCDSSATTERSDVTTRGYRRFRCRNCGHNVNEWTGSIFNCLHYPPDVICLVVLWRVRHEGLMERKLAAILSADVKGYSRLMGEDEEATIRTLTAYRAVMTAYIQQQRGRVVDSPGDNLLAEFASVVDAVRCAVAIQHELQERNTDVPVQRKMEFRIGLNLGDVVVEGERIYGDGVNIAARLESLAEPNGICISGTVYDQVETKLPLTYEYLGEQTVKNIRCSTVVI